MADLAGPPPRPQRRSPPPPPRTRHPPQPTPGGPATGLAQARADRRRPIVASEATSGGVSHPARTYGVRAVCVVRPSEERSHMLNQTMAKKIGIITAK